MIHSITVTPELLKMNDFGVTLKGGRTYFKVWSPTSESVRVALYDTWNQYYRSEFPMLRDMNGCWTFDASENLEGKYYTYLVSHFGQDYEVVDPWAKSAAPNGKRGFIVDVSTISPEGWEGHSIPPMPAHGHLLLYEAHIRDFSIHPESGIQNKGKYLGLTERGTKTAGGFSTGIDYLKELGVTHLHLLPVADFATVDELDPWEYNWGYDPLLFNVPEGSYSTEPRDGRSRIMEFKKAVKALHEAGIRVVLDVVYNHTFHGAKSNLNYLVNNYYYRIDLNHRFTNGSGVGNELATENQMVRRFIVDSLKYWLTEYKVDGFRFDLLGLYDRDTVKTICSELTALRPDILLYGEPWVGGDSGLSEERRFLKGAQRGLPIAVFNDDFRNDLKGNNDGFEEGFITGETGAEEWVSLGLSGSIELSESKRGFASAASETVNYLSCHDNLCLYDKIVKVEAGQPFEMHKAMARLGLSMLLSSFGIPFVAMGSEFLRTKYGHHNSYNAPDSINQVDWHFRENHDDLVVYFREFFKFRKSQRIFGEGNAEIIRKAFHVLLVQDNTVIISITSPYKEDYSEILFIHYAGWADKEFLIPGIGGMKVLSCGKHVAASMGAMKVLQHDKIKVRGVRSVVLVRK